jgi:flagellar hook-length control protein FliK
VKTTAFQPDVGVRLSRSEGRIERAAGGARFESVLASTRAAGELGGSSDDVGSADAADSAQERAADSATEPTAAERRERAASQKANDEGESGASDGAEAEGHASAPDAGGDEGPAAQETPVPTAVTHGAAGGLTEGGVDAVVQAEVVLASGLMPTAFTRPVTVRTLSTLLLHGRGAGEPGSVAPGAESELAGAATESTRAASGGGGGRLVWSDPEFGGLIAWPEGTEQAGEHGSGPTAKGEAGRSHGSGEENARAEARPVAAAKDAAVPVPTSPRAIFSVVTVPVTVAVRMNGAGMEGGSISAAASVGGSGAASERGRVGVGRADVAPGKAASESAESAALKAQVVRGLSAAFARQSGDGEFTLNLQPATLGAVRVQMRVGVEGVTARIEVESLDALKAVRATLPDLQRGFEDRGLKVDRLEAVHVPAADASGTPFVERVMSSVPDSAASPWNGAGMDAQGGGGERYDGTPGRSPGSSGDGSDQPGDTESPPGESAVLTVNLVALRLDAVA